MNFRQIWMQLYIFLSWKCIWKFLHQVVTSCFQILLCSSMVSKVKPLSHSTAIPRRWHGDLKFLRVPWDRTKILENIANNFTFSIMWRCHGAPTATVVFPRSAHGVLPRSSDRRLTAWSQSAHGMLVAFEELSLCIDSVHTARRVCWMRFYGIFTECIRTY